MKLNGCHVCNGINYEGEKDRTQLCLKVCWMSKEERQSKRERERGREERLRERD